MMDTVLNLGLNDRVGRGAGRAHRQRALRLGLLPAPRPDVRQRRMRRPASVFEERIAAAQARAGRDPGHGARRRRRCARSSAIFQAAGYDFPSDPREQLARRSGPCSTRGTAPARSSTGASTAFPTNGAPPSTCSRWCSATRARRRARAWRSAETRSPALRSRAATSCSMRRARTSSPACDPRDLSELADWLPDVNAQLMEILRTLERHYGDMQDTEFTIEERRLYMLQTRAAKRPAQAAVRFAVDTVGGGPAGPRPGDGDDRPEHLDALLHPTFDPTFAYQVVARGVAASPGAAKGAIVFTADDAVAAAREGPGGDPRPAVHRGRRRRRLPCRQGSPDLRGRQGVPRRAGGARDGATGRHRRGRRSTSTSSTGKCARTGRCSRRAT